MCGIETENHIVLRLADDSLVGRDTDASARFLGGNDPSQAQVR